MSRRRTGPSSDAGSPWDPSVPDTHKWRAVVGPRVREVTHDASGPYRLGPEDVDDEWGDVAICLCGLADSYPFCDGSHRRTDDEADGVRYKYVDGERRRVELRYVDGDGKGGGDRDDGRDDREATGDDADADAGGRDDRDD